MKKLTKEQIEIINEVIKDNDFYQSYEELKECTEDNECLFSIRDIEEAVKLTSKKVQDKMLKDNNTFQVKPCHDGKFKDIECLESQDQYGFQTDEHDFRPAWHTWIDKEDCEKLYNFFMKKYKVKK